LTGIKTVSKLVCMRSSPPGPKDALLVVDVAPGDGERALTQMERAGARQAHA
jgi:hypothetical protein